MINRENLAGSLRLLLLLILFGTVKGSFAQSAVWTSVSGGDWSNPLNWTGGTVGSGTDVTADFSGVNLPGDATVHLDQWLTVGNLVFGDADTNSAAGWYLDNKANTGNALYLSTSTGISEIKVQTLAPGKSVTLNLELAGNALTKTGPGTLILGTNNSYTGGTIINQGLVQVSNIVGTLGAGKTDSVTLNGGGIAAYFGMNQTVFWPINVDTNGGEIDLLQTASNGRWTFSGNILAGSGTLTIKPQKTRFILNSQTASGFSGKWILDGTNGTGAGYVMLNTASGESCLGASPISFTADAVLMKNNVTLMSPQATSQVGSATRGITIGPGGGTFSVAGAYVFSVDSPIGSTGSDNVTFLGNNNNAGVKLNSANNSYAGNTIIANGGAPANTVFLRLGISEAVPSGPGKGVVSFTGGNAALDLNGFNQTINGFGASLSSSKVDNIVGGGSSTLTVGSADTNSSFAGAIKNTSGTVNLVKIGAGVLTLSGTNTYSGSTTVSNGTLQLSGYGSISTSSSIVVAAGATLDVSTRSDSAVPLGASQVLAGNGTINGSVNAVAGSSISPGNPTGTLVITTNLYLGGTLNISVDTAGVANNFLQVNGVLALSNNCVLNLTVANGPLGAGPYIIAQYGSLTGAPFTTITGLPANYTLIYNYKGANQIAIVRPEVGTPPAIPYLVGPAVGECGGNPSFIATVTGDNPSIQWYTNGVAVPGQGSTTLTLTNVHLGSYAVSVIATNSSGRATNSMSMTVLDTTGPAIFITGANPMYVRQGQTFTDPGATAQDACAGLRPASSSGAVNVNVLGTYGVTYTADDSNGNTNRASRTVVVVDDRNYVWTNPTVGNWSSPENWVGGLVGSGSDQTADFSQVPLTADAAIHLDQSVTIGNLKFGNLNTNVSAGWSLDDNGQGNVLTLSTSSNSPVITVPALGSGKKVSISAVIDGYAGLTKDGPGTLVFSQTYSNNHNTYFGGTQIKEGFIQISDIDGTLGNSTGNNVTLNGGGIAALFTGTKTSGWPITVDTNGGEIVLLQTTGGNWVFSQNTISGTGQLTLRPGGNRFSLGDQTWSGFTGKWVVDGANRLPTLTQGLVTSPTADLDSGFGPMPADFIPDAITLINNAGLMCANYTDPFIGSPNRGITIGPGGGSFIVAGAWNCQLNSRISGSTGDPVYYEANNGNAGVQLNHPGNSYNGNTVIYNNGQAANVVFLRLGVDEAIPSGPGKGVVAYSSGTAVLDLNGFNQTINGFGASTSSSLVDNMTSGVSSTLTVGSADTNSAFAGVIQNATGTINLVKVGSGTLALSGVNTYTGTTTVSNGTLIGVSGGACASSMVTVANSATQQVRVATSAGQWICQGLSLRAGAALTFDWGSLALSTSVAPLKVLDTLVTDTVNPVALQAGSYAPGSYPLISYGALAGGGFGALQFKMASGYSGSLSNDVPGHTIWLVVTAGLLTPPAIQPVFAQGTNLCIVTASSVAGRTYVLESTPSLNPGATIWTPVWTNWGSGGPITNLVPVSPAKNRQFFRFLSY